jgi:Cation transport ATPase
MKPKKKTTLGHETKDRSPTLTDKGNAAPAQQKQYKFKISKMDCASCAETIVDTVKRIDGVKNARLNFVNETLYVDSDANNLSPDEIIKMVKFAGFGAELIDEAQQTILQGRAIQPAEGKNKQEKPEAENLRFKIEGMHCANCARTIEKGVGKIDGINKVTVNFAGESGFVSFTRP